MMISSIGADQPEAAPGAIRPYLQAKTEADHHPVASGLDYPIVRASSQKPSHLRNFMIANTRHADRRARYRPGPPVHRTGRARQVPRDDVAAILAEVLQAPNTIGIIAELFTGNTPTAQAVLSLQHPAPAGDAQHHRERAAR